MKICTQYNVSRWYHVFTTMFQDDTMYSLQCLKMKTCTHYNVTRRKHVLTTMFQDDIMYSLQCFKVIPCTHHHGWSYSLVVKQRFPHRVHLNKVTFTVCAGVSYGDDSVSSLKGNTMGPLSNIQCVQIKAPVFKLRLWTIGVIFSNNSKSM